MACATRAPSGEPQPDVKLVILDDAGKEASAGEAGDVYARLTTAATSPITATTRSARKAERDGLISVGDIGYVDADGFLFLCDRRNHMVISGGVNIYPAEIEAEILKIAGRRRLRGVRHSGRRIRRGAGGRRAAAARREGRARPT